MDYKTPFFFLMRQPHRWSSLLSGSLLLLVPIAGPMALAGWFAQVVRAVIRGQDQVPPLRLGDFSKLIRIGTAPFLVQLVWGIILGMIFQFLVGMAYNVIFILAMFAGFGAAAAAGGGGEPSDPAIVIAVVLASLTMGAVTLVGAHVMDMLLNAVIVRSEVNLDFGRSIGPGAPFRLFRRSWRELLWSSVAVACGGSILFLIGLLTLGIGLLPAMFLATVARTHLRAQVYANDLARGGTPEPIAPIPDEMGRPSMPPPAVPYGGAPPTARAAG